jgi:hypothetical protein
VSYARTDRLRVDPAGSTVKKRPRGCDGDVFTHRLQDEARFKGVVQRDRVLVYERSSMRETFVLTTVGEPLCADVPRYQIGAHVGTGRVDVYREDWLQAPQ